MHFFFFYQFWFLFLLLHIFQLTNNTHTLQNLPKYNMFTIQMVCWLTEDEELWAICIRACICHTEKTRLVMLERNGWEKKYTDLIKWNVI